MNRRFKLEIIHDILNSIREKGGSIKPTHLLYKSNLSHQKMKEYVEELIGKRLMEEKIEKKNRIFILTDQGYRFIQEFKKFKEFAESFGL
jgi:predicted transcriptional regulator